MNQDVKEIEIGKKEAQKMVDAATSLDRLNKNRDFNRVVLEGYFKTEACRLTMLLSDPEFQSEADQKDLFIQLKSIANFRTYLNTRGFIGDQAAAAIDDMDAALDELRAEEDEA